MTSHETSTQEQPASAPSTAEKAPAIKQPKAKSAMWAPLGTVRDSLSLYMVQEQREYGRR